MTLPQYLDIITPAYAIADPQLSSYAVDDVMLLRMIKAASAMIQVYLNWVFTFAEITALPEDIKVASVLLVIELLVPLSDEAGVDSSSDLRRVREQLGDRAYEFEFRENPGSLIMPNSIARLLHRYIVAPATVAPRVVSSSGWRHSVPPSHLRTHPHGDI